MPASNVLREVSIVPASDVLLEASPESSLPAGDTIAAIATASGPAGIGIIRVSGSRAFSIISRLLAGGRRSIADQRGHTLRQATIYDPATSEPIDDALLAVFHAPRSLTGEDVVEIQGHGGPVTLTRVFAACLAAGARAARAGEFSERAFVAGKLDLAQAEAVADLVSAGTIAAQRAALRQVTGELSRAIQSAAQPLKAALAMIEASIDFPEDVGEIDAHLVGGLLNRAEESIRKLLSTAGYGIRLRQGLSVVLAGRPNVGKSSLLNALSGTDRAIVTAIPGTTRDIVEEVLHMRGIPVRALDTAGLRETDDPVERIGVERARAAAAVADVVVMVMDASTGITEEDTSLISSIRGGALVVAINKADIAPNLADAISAVQAAINDSVRVVPTSTVTGKGLEALTSAIAAAGSSGSDDIVSLSDTAPIVTSARHEDALRRAAAAILGARATLESCLPPELIAVDIHGSLLSLGEITGETAREDIIASIFATFCIGK